MRTGWVAVAAVGEFSRNNSQYTIYRKFNRRIPLRDIIFVCWIYGQLIVRDYLSAALIVLALDLNND